MTLQERIKAARPPEARVLEDGSVEVTLDVAWLLAQNRKARERGDTPSARDIGWAIITAQEEALDPDPDTSAKRAFRAWENAADWEIGLGVLAILEHFLKRRAVPKGWKLRLKLRDFGIAEWAAGDDGRWHRWK